MTAKLLQCCLPNNCGNECCECFFGYENKGSNPRACGLTIRYIYAFGDGFLYNNTTFISQNVGPSCPYSADQTASTPPSSWVPFTTTYTSWWYDALQSGIAQMLTDKAKEDGIIGSSTNIDLYGDYSTNTMIPYFDPDCECTQYRAIEVGDIIPFVIAISYYDRITETYAEKFYDVTGLTYKEYTCALSRLATVTWYDTIQPDGTYWSIANDEATLTPWL